MQTCPACGSINTSEKRVRNPDTGQDCGSYDQCGDCGTVFNRNVDID